MNKYIKISSPFVFFITLILILTFKTLPSGKLWKNYFVVSVPVSTPDSTVLTAIDKASIQNAVSLSGQYLPLSLSENSVELCMLRLNYKSSEYAYLDKRNAMFFDKSQAYRLYYIPGEYESETNTLVKLLANQGINCIKDDSSNYPWLLPFIGFLLALMLFLFVKNKLPFILCSIIPLVYLYCNPFYPAATAICLTILCLFFVSNLWRRKGALTILLSRYSGPAMLAIAIICSFAASLTSGFLFILTLAGIAAALIISACLQEFFRNKKPFVPVYIRSAKRVSPFAGKAFTSMSIVTGAVALFIVLIFVTSSDSITQSSAKLLFPANSNNSEGSLPQFDEYYDLVWKVRTYPYKSLNSQEADSNTVFFSSFIENPETGIITEEKTSLTFNDAFKQEVFDEIDSLRFNSIEKIMKSEGQDFTAGYTATSSYHTNLFGIIMCFICLFILLFIYFSIIIRKGINK